LAYKKEWVGVKILLLGFILLLLAACDYADRFDDLYEASAVAQPTTVSPITVPLINEPSSLAPTPVPGTTAAPIASFRGSRAIAVAASGSSSFAILYDNSLWAWGVNARGQLGSSRNTSPSYRPLRIMGDVTAVAANGLFAYAITTDGGLWRWGGSIEQSLPVRIMDNVIAVSTSWDHTLALTDDGVVWAWGSNWWWGMGYLYGRETVVTHYDRVQVLEDVTAIAAGPTSMAIKTDGSLWVWGSTWTIGSGFIYPTRIKENIVAIANNRSRVSRFLAITDEGCVWKWQLLNYEPELLDIPEHIVAVNAGGDQGWAISEEGNLWRLWGNEDELIFSLLWPYFAEIHELDPAMYNDDITWWALPEYISDAYFAFLREDNRYDDALRIVRLPILYMENVRYINHGNDHTLLITTNGDVWARGRNHQGQLGDGTRQDHHRSFINISALR